MPDYRAYIIGTDGRFDRAVVLECDNDDTAMSAAQQLVDGHDIELWQRDRKVATILRNGVRKPVD